MKYAFSILVITLMFITCGQADEPKKGKTYADLFPSFKGEWGELDLEAKSEKPTFVQLGKYENKGKFPTEWHIGLVFGSGDRKGYYGAAEKVEVDGETVKIHLPAPGKNDDKRTTRTFTIKRVGEKLELELLDGDVKGKYELEKPKRDKNK